MKIFVIGASRSAKTPFAERVAARLGVPRIGASEWFRKHLPDSESADRQAFVERITRFSIGVLRRDPDVNVRHLRAAYDLEAGSVIEGVRNPHDFVHLFDPRADRVVFLECDECDVARTVFEGGIGVIEAYLSHLAACGLLSDPAVQVRAYRFERFYPDPQAGNPAPGTFTDLDAVYEDFESSLPERAPMDAPAPKTSRVHAEIEPLRCAVRQEFLYDLDPSMAGPLIPATAFSVSSYLGSVPTFNVLLEDGAVFSYLPPQALVDPARFRPGTALDDLDLSYQNCPDGAICVNRYEALSGPVQAYLKRRDEWMGSAYVLTIDWYEGNDLLHLVALANGQYAFLPQHKLKFGSEAARSFRPYRKLRKDWSV
ncbi:MAG: hypothetical protein AAB554_03680 [Patescibacteria group bacterium]